MLNDWKHSAGLWDRALVTVLIGLRLARSVAQMGPIVRAGISVCFSAVIRIRSKTRGFFEVCTGLDWTPPQTPIDGNLLFKVLGC